MIATRPLCGLRAQFPDCSMIAFADLSARMVLMTSANRDVPQERWDGLCEMAHEALRAGSSHAVLACLGAPPPAILARAAHQSASKSYVFLSAAVPDFALCAVGHQDMPLSDFYAAAQPVLDQLVRND